MPSGVYKRTEKNRTGFKKGNQLGLNKTPKNKGVSKYKIHYCIKCEKKLTRPCSNKTGKCGSCVKFGLTSNLWKGNAVGYMGLHNWIRRNYGKAKICQNTLCKNKSKTFDWALLKEFNYQRDITKFIQLCRSCHTSYDKYNNVPNI